MGDNLNKCIFLFKLPVATATLILDKCVLNQFSLNGSYCLGWHGGALLLTDPPMCVFLCYLQILHRKLEIALRFAIFDVTIDCPNTVCF